MNWRKDEEKMKAALSLTSQRYWAKPFRTFVLKESDKERIVKVPCNYDAAIQVLYAYALDPVYEALADPKSFGFRKGRSQLDAHAHILNMFNIIDPPVWVLRADIKSYHNQISHKWLLDNIPMDKEVLYKFLKAGVFEKDFFYETDIGMSMGSALSPILANMALDGLQFHIYKVLNNLSENMYMEHLDYFNGNMVRFADDMVITARTKSYAVAIKNIVSDFLAERGLMLNEEKTYIVNIEEGFDFLSRKYIMEDQKICSYPSDRALENFEAKIVNYIAEYKGSQERLIKGINKRLIGWANYHRVSDAYEAFKRIDLVVQACLIRKMRELHPKWYWKTIQNKYWNRTGVYEYTFTLPTNPTVKVVKLTNPRIYVHKPVKVKFNPYLDQEYFEWLQFKRDIRKRNGTVYKGIWNRQNGKCYFCGETMHEDEEVEIIQKDLQNNMKNANNLAYVHKKCLRDEISDDEIIFSFDVFENLEKITEVEDFNIYSELSEFFRFPEETPLSVSFEKIEDMLGEKLPDEAYEDEKFWTDKISDSGETNTISSILEEHGYYLWSVNFKEQKIVLRRTKDDIKAFKVPKQLTERKIRQRRSMK